MKNNVSPAREAVLYVLSRCRRFDAWSQQTLESAVEKFSLERRDGAFCTRLCLSVLQNAALCDWYIGAFSSVRPEQMEPQVRDILRMGICQILFMDRVPDPAAVAQAVEQTKRSAPKAAGLVNAVLRRVADRQRDLPDLPDSGTAQELSIRYSHPLWLCDRLVSEYGYDHARAYLAANNREPGLTLTVNLCRTNAVSLCESLAAAGLSARVSELSPVSVETESGNVGSLPGYGEGLFFVQDAAAARSVLAADPKPGMRVLDACAAPGGKSLLAAILMGDRGSVLSCDLHAKKLSRIEENAERLGLTCIQTAPMDAAKPLAALKDGFDLVLADVPCSGLGVIRKKPEIRYRPEADLRGLPEVQARILEGAAACVRPGGTLLYSTCTILREENDAVADWFLAAHPGFREEERRTIWPQEHGTDGFFYCRMKRYD